MIMAVAEDFLELFLQSQDKYKLRCDAFEEHFVWLEEALIVAKQSFKHTNETLLPKTPAAKKRVRKKKLSNSVLEEGEPPSKRASVESTISQPETESPEMPTQRRGRAASRIAQERVSKNIKDSIKRKLRRPSTPEPTPRTTKQAKPTKQIETSVEVVGSLSEEIAPVESCKGQNQETSSRVEVCGQDLPKILQNQSPEKPSQLNRRSSSIGRKLIYYQSSSEEEKVISKSPRSLESAVDVGEQCEGCRVEKKNNHKQNPASHVCGLREDSGIGECTDERSSTENITSETLKNNKCKVKTPEKITHTKATAEDNEVDIWKDCESLQSQPVPKIRSTRTKHVEVLPVQPDKQTKNLEVTSSYEPVAKPRTTRTKQRQESQVDSDPSDSAFESKVKEQRLISRISDDVFESEMQSHACSEEGEDSQGIAVLLSSQEVPKVQSTPTKMGSTEMSKTPKDYQNNIPNKSRLISEDDNTSECLVDSFLPPEVPKMRTTRTKKKHVENVSVSDDSGAEVSKPRSTRTKKKCEDPMATEILEATENSLNSKVVNDHVSESELVIEVLQISTTSTKNIQDDLATSEMSKAPKDCQNDISKKSRVDAEDHNTSECSTDSFLPPEVPKMRTTRTKKKQVENVSTSDDSGAEISKPRSTRTKKKLEEESVEKADADNVSQSDVVEMIEINSPLPSRSTRTKKRQVEEQEAVNQPARSKRTKRKKVEDGGDSEKENTSSLANSTEEVNPTNTDDVDEIQALPKATTTQRVTRSKIRQPPGTRVSPKKGSPCPSKLYHSPSGPRNDFHRDCSSPRSNKGTPTNRPQMVSRVGSPLKSSPRPYKKDKLGRADYYNRVPFQKVEVLREVEEISMNDIEVTRSPARITRHSGGKAVKDADAKFARINPVPRTLSPQCPADKIIRPKLGFSSSSGSSYGSSGRITPKTYSRIRPGLMNSSSSSTEYNRIQKKIDTPTDGGKRIKNLVTGITSFIKVQAPKPTKEELENKRLKEIQQKRERETDNRRKKEDILKSKIEEQKRRNEERMKRAKEAREENERKAAEAKELQQTERKQREERLKEEQQRKKQQLVAKKQAEEEAKARKVKEQLEEEKRRLKEIRLAEEAKKAEEAKRIEEERKAEEQKILLEEKRKKRAAEVERITRERKEMEQLKIREAERLLAAKKVANSTFTKNSPENQANSTFTKGPAEDKENVTNPNSTFTKPPSKNNDSYEMTPDRKKKTQHKTQKCGNNYNINDIKSDDSTDDDSAPKKTIPTWAQGNQLKASLLNQDFYPPNIIAIFPPEDLLVMPDLMQIFPIARRRFLKRTSSAVWTTPPCKLMN